MAAFYKTKGWYKSKTVWAGIVTALLGVLALFGIGDGTNAETVVNAIFAVLGVIGVYGRVTATEAIVTPATPTIT